MEKQDFNPRELLSALVDEQLAGDERTKALSALLSDPDAQKRWHAYHVAGDVLSSEDLAPKRHEFEFLERLQLRLASEPAHPTIVTPKLAVVTAKNSANMGDARRSRTGAGIALGVCAVVAVMMWNGLAGPTETPTQQAANHATTPIEAPTALNAEAQVVLRDPELDALLAAHRAAGGNSALQLPAGFLRNATFERPNR